MDKLKMHSLDLSQQNIEKIRALFPNCVTEVDNSDCSIKLAVDFDLLKQELSDSIVEGPQERYHLNWPGKREALLTANAPIAKTLRPYREESVDFDTTQNLFIEGDNLEALKLLQEAYLARVKMIYIDPPYNTGTDFIYEDDFSEDFSSFMKKSNQQDDAGNRLIANTDSNGRFHSDWLSMLYARIKLARNLLTEDGVIFISIDDKELPNLLKICNEIFGESNFESCITWRRRHNQPNDKTKMIGKVAEYILVYSKNTDALVPGKSFQGLPLSEERLADYKNPDKDPKGPWSTNPWKAAVGRGGTTYSIETPTGKIFTETWYGNQETFNKLLSEDRVYWTSNGDGVPRIKIYLSEGQKFGQSAINFFTHEKFGSNQDGSAELKELMGESGLFDNPKPTKLLRSLIRLASSNDDIVMDFFAGSASFAHSVFLQNAEDGANRRFIQVQLPEHCDSKSATFKAGFKTISDLSKERIRKAGQKVRLEPHNPLWKKDTGFRVVKIDSSNMTDVFYSANSVDQASLNLLIDNIKPDRTDEDLLFQVLIDWGLDLTLPIKKQAIAGKSFFLLSGNTLAACFDTCITEELIQELAKLKPLRAVFRDDGFQSDALKINAEQIFRQLSPHTEIKTI